MVVLDASGRVRATYREWESKRGGLVRLKEATKSYSNLTVHVWTTGGGKSAFAKRGKTLVDGIATTINTKSEDEWLVVCHKPKPGFWDVETDVRELLTGSQDKVHFITWGNHYATNAYSNVPNVILAGTLFWPASAYESLGRLAAAFPSDRGRYPEESFKAVMEGEHSHLILQALCRGSVRLCKGSDCAPCDAYIIASVNKGIPDAIPRIFPGCTVLRWRPIPRALTGKVREAVGFIAQWFGEHDQDYLPFKLVKAAINMTDSANFKNCVRRHPDFVEELVSMGIVEYGKGIYPRGFLRITSLDEHCVFDAA